MATTAILELQLKADSLETAHEVIHATPGCCMYFPPGTIHSARGTGDKTMELVYGFSPPDWERVGCVWVE